jgi:hypothetical protein
MQMNNVDGAFAGFPINATVLRSATPSSKTRLFLRQACGPHRPAYVKTNGVAGRKIVAFDKRKQTRL